MDERLEKALKFSNYMVTLNNQKKLLKEKYFEDLLYFNSGCQFTVTKELITFVGLLIDRGNDSDVVLTDDNDIPAKISDLKAFYEGILNAYFTAANNYHTQYEELRKNRSVELLINHE